MTGLGTELETPDSQALVLKGKVGLIHRFNSLQNHVFVHLNVTITFRMRHQVIVSVNKCYRTLA